MTRTAFALPRRAALRLLSAVPALSGVIGCSREEPESDPIRASMARIKPLFSRKTPPRSDDWLASHRETGQSYAEYRDPSRQPVVSRYATLRVVPIGPLSAGQSAVLETVTDFLTPFFGLQLSLDPQVPLEEIPADAQRIPYEDARNQLLTTYLLQQVLPRRRAATDAAVLAITAQDLWPGPGWNFVFGQGSLSERVGVWSMARSGDVDAGPEIRHKSTVRTVKTATHETAHMLGIKHCTAYECGMNGANHQEERDRQPVEFCPECQAKIWWTCKLDPVARSEALSAVARKHGLSELSAWWHRQAELLAGKR